MPPAQHRARRSLHEHGSRSRLIASGASKDIFDTTNIRERRRVRARVGVGLCPQCEALTGTRVTDLRNDDPVRTRLQELQRLTGVAPVTSSSGGRQGTLTVYRRLKRSKFLHQTIVEWAGCAVAQSAWANAYYQHQLSRGKRRFSILRALAFKLLRILFFCWKNNVHYDEKHHQESLSRHGSPLAKLLAA